VGFSFDQRSLKTNALDVERSFTCCHLVEFWWEIVNLKNEVDKKKTTRLFVEEFHTPDHIFLCIENTCGLKV
jgi:3,4-dihydroxy 2-butanone 4-phosphate synthase